VPTREWQDVANAAGNRLRILQGSQVFEQSYEAVDLRLAQTLLALADEDGVG